jgi:head-tail adaptor
MSLGLGLNRPLVLETPVETGDGAGGLAVTWVGLGTLWAAVKARTGRAVTRGGGEAARLALEIVVRGAPEGAPDRPRPGQRFREGTRLYRIVAVAERDAAGRMLSCTAIEERPA